MQMENDWKILDLAPLFSGETDRIEFDRTFPWDLNENGITSSSLAFTGSVALSAGEFLLKGTAVCALRSECARCLAPVTRDLSVEIESWVLKEPEEDREALVAENDVLDLFGIAEEATVLELPLRMLCREDCKGLCPKCGKDLNQGDCGCKKTEADPRLAKLADFFK